MNTLGLGGGGNMGAPAISPHDPRVMFLACDLGGLYRSEDFGESWQLVDARGMRGDNNGLRIDGNPIPVCAVVFDPVNVTRVYAYGPSCGLRFSADGGKSFPDQNILYADSPVGQGPPLKMTALGIDPGMSGRPVLFGTALGVYQWDGNQYVQTNLFDKSGQFNAVGFFVEENMHMGHRTFYAAVGSRIYTRTEVTTTWMLLKDFVVPIQSFAGADDVNGTTLYATIGTRMKGQLITSDVLVWNNSSGVWKSSVTGFEDKPFYLTIACARNDRDFAYLTVSADVTPSPPNFNNIMGVYRNTQGGAGSWQSIFWYTDYSIRELIKNQNLPNYVPNVETGWQEWELKSASESPPNGITVCPTNPDVVLVVNQGAYITRSAKTILPGQTDDKWRQVHTKKIGIEDKQQPWASRGLEVTSTWQYHIRLSARNEHYICYTDLGLARSEDGGATWTRIAVPRRGFSQTQANADPSMNSWINAYELAETVGALFLAVSSLHDIPQDTILEKGLAHEDGGVYISTDGKIWKDISDNLPHCPVTSLIIDNHYFLWAAVFGDGVWRRHLGGGTWLPVGTPGTNKNVTRLRFEKKNNGQWSILCSVMKDKTGDKGGVFRFTNGQWMTVFDPVKLNAGYPVDFGFNKDDPNDEEHYFVGTLGGNPYGGVYEKQGANWQKVLDFAGNDQNTTYMSPKNAPYDYLLTGFGAEFWSGRVFITTDTHGIWVRWAPVPDGPEQFTELLDADGKRVLYLRNTRMLFDTEQRDEPIGLYKAGPDLIAQGGFLALVGILLIFVAIILYIFTFGAARLFKHETRDLLYLCTFGYGVIKILITNWHE
jgi:hypothetical protein